VRGVRLWEDDAGWGCGSDLNDEPRANTKLLVEAVNAGDLRTFGLRVARAIGTDRTGRTHEEIVDALLRGEQ
jgi:hypothetical protein